jgi:hypothetical protein
MGAPKAAARQMHGMMAPCAPPPACMSARIAAKSCDKEHYDDGDDDGVAMCSFGGGGGLGRGGGAARHTVRASVTTGPPRIEHLASAAVLSANIQVDASGATSIKLPDDFDGVALVMLSSDWSCEWHILHAKSSLSASRPSLLQRQLCLTQPFSPQSHMARQASVSV